MSEYPDTIASLDGHREGSRLDNSTHVDLHAHTVPRYNADAIAQVHQIEAARQARQAAAAAERELLKSGPESARDDLSRLMAIRAAAINGDIRMAG